MQVGDRDGTPVSCPSMVAEISPAEIYDIQALRERARIAKRHLVAAERGYDATAETPSEELCARCR